MPTELILITDERARIALKIKNFFIAVPFNRTLFIAQNVPRMYLDTGFISTLLSEPIPCNEIIIFYTSVERGKSPLTITVRNRIIK